VRTLRDTAGVISALSAIIVFWVCFNSLFWLGVVAISSLAFLAVILWLFNPESK